MALQETLAKIIQDSGKKSEELTQREKAILIHDYVRDHVKFGFSKNFDQACVSYTTSVEVGHCNPKGRLFVGLLKEAGIQARQHFVNIPKYVLRGVIPTYDKMGDIVTHSYAEVNLNKNGQEKWIKVDSYVVDKSLFASAEKRLKESIGNGEIDPIIPGQGGFGIRIGGSCSWDGQSESFSQYDPRAAIHDFVDDN